jgi:hypothetical protein
MNDLIKRDDALAALTLGNTMTVLQGRINTIPAIDPAAIREDALREAAAVAKALSVIWWAEYKDRLSLHSGNPHYQGMSDGADDVAIAILALIGEKK